MVHSFLIVIALIGLAFAPRTRCMLFRTLAGVLGAIVFVLTLIWASGSRPSRRWW